MEKGGGYGTRRAVCASGPAWRAAARCAWCREARPAHCAWPVGRQPIRPRRKGIFTRLVGLLRFPANMCKVTCVILCNPCDLWRSVSLRRLPTPSVRVRGSERERVRLSAPTNVSCDPLFALAPLHNHLCVVCRAFSLLAALIRVVLALSEAHFCDSEMALSNELRTGQRQPTRTSKVRLVSAVVDSKARATSF